MTLCNALWLITQTSFLSSQNTGNQTSAPQAENWKIFSGKSDQAKRKDRDGGDNLRQSTQTNVFNLGRLLDRHNGITWAALETTDATL